MNLIPLIEQAKPYNGVVIVDAAVYKYTCRRFEVAKDREKYVVALLDELGTGYKIWPSTKGMITVDIINNNEVLDIVRRAV